MHRSKLSIIAAFIIATATGCTQGAEPLPPQAAASPPPKPAPVAEPKRPDATDLERCKIAEDAARSIMTARQRGIAMSKVMEVAASPENQAMTVKAYEEPRYSSDKHRTRAVEDFSSAAYLACIQAVGT